MVMPASDALEHVLNNAGGSFPKRDAVDEFLINEVRSFGTLGKIIEREGDNGIPGNVGSVENGISPLDSDRDGMPDAWESDHGLNPNDASDQNGTDLSDDGYTNIEMYVNELAGDPVVFANEIPLNTLYNSSAKLYQSGAQIYNPIKESSEYLLLDLKGNKLYQGSSLPKVLPRGLYIQFEIDESGHKFKRSLKWGL
jgi:hypothetical protein